MPPNAATSAVIHPKPQLRRTHWCELGGDWEFAFDDTARGIDEHWESADRFDRLIAVPFPPESQASTIGDLGFHPVLWYRRTLTAADLSAAGHDEQGSRTVLHFGAVDYRAQVWLDGHYLGRHDGGHTPFSFDITPLVAERQGPWTLVVRAVDDPRDVAQPRGKQDWELQPHGIWYHRTSGIWQPVWLECVPELHIADLTWSCDLPAATVTLDLELSAHPAQLTAVTVELSIAGEQLARVQVTQQQIRSRTVITLSRQTNGQAYESLLWSPESPRLIDATIQLSPTGQAVTGEDGCGQVADTVVSYLGLRSVGWADRHFLLNDRPYYVRAVLEQGYWPESHLAAPTADALRAEVQLIKDLGFNTARIHEKAEDPRFLYWADKLGVMIWAECPSAYEFSPTAVEQTTREWIDIIRRDRAHPSVVAWVPFNENWGIQHVSHDPAQLDYTRALYHLTKAIDPTRLVISNDGWEQADSDIWTLHDYAITRDEVAANYVDEHALDDLLAGIGPLGRRMRLLPDSDRKQPVIVSEFGGVSYAPTEDVAWGYLNVTDASAYEQALRDLFEALQSSPVLAGFCYTHLTDTLQEANGLTDPNRQPKLPIDVIRHIVEGHSVDISAHRRPKKPIEQPHAS